MIRYALNNLVAKKVRTLLSLVLLSMVLAGTIGLISLSFGMRHSVSSALSKVEGIAVILKGSADPLFSVVPMTLVERIAALEGTRVVTPEIWGIVAQLDGQSPLTKGWFSAAAFSGMDPARVEKIDGGGVYGRAIRSGRFLRKGDRSVAVMSRKLADEYGKRLGGTLNLNGREFTLTGIYETGSLFLDQTIIIPIEDARTLKNMRADAASAIYVEVGDTTETGMRAVAGKIEALMPGIEAKTKYDWHEEFGSILGNLDAFFSAQSGYIASLGVIIVLLTMTMSVMERTREFGILKAVGWTRRDVMRLIILESAVLGGVSGVVGCALGVVSTVVLGEFLPFRPEAHPLLVAGTFVGGVALGLIGGVYPAYRASSLNPVEAIRTE
ncbi:MAG: ABC transporter permease [Planctomycetota bacterium]